MRIMATRQGGVPIGVSPRLLQVEAECKFCHAIYGLMVESEELERVSAEELSEWLPVAQQVVASRLEDDHADMLRHSTSFTADLPLSSVSAKAS